MNFVFEQFVSFMLVFILFQDIISCNCFYLFNNNSDFYYSFIVN